MDINLGNDNGTDLIDLIRTRNDMQNQDTPILVISGFIDKVLMKKIAHRIQGALVKPFQLIALIGHIKKVTETSA